MPVVVPATVREAVPGFACDEEDAVVNVPQHGAAVLRVRGLQRLLLHLPGNI